METKMGVGPSRQKRRMVLVIGLVVIGLMLAALVGMRFAGGRSAAKGPRSGGLNTVLPGAHFKAEKPMDKLGVMEKADRDSARRTERGNVYARMSFESKADSSAGRLMGQLDNLKRLLHPVGAEMAEVAPPAPGIRLFKASAADPAPEPAPRQRLEELLRVVHRPDTGRSDPQLERLSGMLDKIMKIQRGPGGINDSNKLVAPVAPAMLLKQPAAERAVSQLGTTNAVETSGFLGIDGQDAEDSVTGGNAFPATIPEAQVLVAGATVALRLLAEARIGGVIVPRDELLYGKVALSGDRLLVTINSIRIGNSVYPMALQVYDLDGLVGIHVPGAITRDVLKQSAAEGVGGMGVLATDGSIGASAAEAGIAAARSLFSRKIALVRVTVPAGYRVLLRNQNNK